MNIDAEFQRSLPVIDSIVQFVEKRDQKTVTPKELADGVGQPLQVIYRVVDTILVVHPRSWAEPEQLWVEDLLQSGTIVETAARWNR